VSGEDDSLHIDSSMSPELAEALRRVEQRLESVEDALGSAGRAGETAGDRIEKGADTAASAMDRARRSAERAERSIDDTADAAERADDTLRDAGKAGRSAASGFDAARKASAAAAEALARTERAAEGAEDALDDAGDEAATSGAQAAVAATGWGKLDRAIARSERASRIWARTQSLMRWNTYAGGVDKVRAAWTRLGAFDWDGHGRKLQATGKKYNNLGKVLKLFLNPVALVIMLLPTLLGLVGALGAGAVSAVAGLAKLTRAAGAFVPVIVAAKVAMLAWKLAQEAVAPQLEKLKGQFSGLGEAVARGGLRRGLTQLTRDVADFADETDRGFGKIGAAFERGAVGLGRMARDGERLAQVRRIFDGMEHILDYLVGTTLNLGRALLTLTDAGTPAGIAMTEQWRHMTGAMADWLDQANRSGKLTVWINAGYDQLRRTIGVLVDFVIGLWHVFKIGGEQAEAMGLSVEAAARRFRGWASSIEGQNAIRQYFIDAMPAFKESLLLIGALFKSIAMLATSEGLAPLLNQLRTEFLPAVAEAIGEITGQGGLLPSILSAGTELAKMFTSLDLSAITALVTLVADGVKWLTQLVQEVPGLSFLVSAFALLYVVGGAALSVIGGGMAAFAWIRGALLMTGELTLAQRLLGGAVAGVRAVGSAMLAVFATLPGGAAVMTAVRVAATSMWTALMGPIGWIILAVLAVVAVVIYLWNNCEWFRDAVGAVWDYIVDSAQVAADFFIWLGGVFMDVFHVIADAAVWAWETVLLPVLTAIWTVLKVIGAIIFTILVAPFVIAWNIISAVFKWTWENQIKPILEALGALIEWLNVTIVQPVLSWIADKWNWLSMMVKLAIAVFVYYVGIISDKVSELWITYVQPILQWISDKWNWLTMMVGLAIDIFKYYVGLVGDKIAELWNTYVKPILDWIADKWDWLMMAFKVAKEMYLDPMFSGIGSGLDTLGTWFRDAVDNIGRIWNDLRNKLAVPINFVIDNVWNNGILAVWNWVAEKLGLPQGKPLDRIPEFREGGPIRGAGGGRTDSMIAKVSNGEHMWTAAEVDAAGGHQNVLHLRRMAREGRLQMAAFASGGPVTPREMLDTVAGALPGTRMTSGYRPGDPGWHGRNRAADLAGPRSGDAAFMRNIDQFIGTKFPGSSELIHTPGPYNIKNGSPHTYSAGVRADHYDHVHWANNGAAAGEGGGGFFGWLAEKAWDVAKPILDGIINPIIDGIPFRGPPQFLDIPRAMAAKARDGIYAWAESKLNAQDAGSTGPYSGAAGSPEVMAAIQTAAAKRGWGSGTQWDSLLKLIQGESGFNPNAQNPTSTAYGLFQFLNSTWGTVGGSKTSNPALQSEYGMRYIGQSYGNPSNAYTRWFSRSPHWYDDGGMLPTGLSMVMNGTGQPEPVFTAAQWDMLDPTNLVAAMHATAPSVEARSASDRDDRIVAALADVAAAIDERAPAMAVSGEDTRRAVLDALAQRDREAEARGRYRYDP
jgi:Transglycosylase SLT domain